RHSPTALAAASLCSGWTRRNGSRLSGSAIRNDYKRRSRTWRPMRWNRFFGPLSPWMSLGGTRSSPSRSLRMLEDVHVVENRGSGIRAMLDALRGANLEPPGFEDRRSSFHVTFRNHTLMNPEAIAWLNQFAHVPLDDRQRVALVYLRQHDQITNGEYQRL